jgi:hypothetical protein
MTSNFGRIAPTLGRITGRLAGAEPDLVTEERLDTVGVVE